MADLWTVDTNILIYAIDPTHAHKHAIGRKLVETVKAEALPLPMQCLAEFYSATVRKGVLKPSEAATIITDYLRSQRIVASTPADLAAAIDLQQRHSLQFFDCMLIATASRAGCRTLFSEDMQHNRSIHQITVVNPFACTPAELDVLMA